MRDRGPIIIAPPRFSAVPWLSTAVDLRPQGDPETVIEQPGEIAYGLHIRTPFGVGTDTMLTVHAVRDTGAITLAVAESVAITTAPIEPAQSNPRRAQDDEGGE